MRVDFALTRHDGAGKLDGIATTDLGGDDDEAFDAALLPDGGIVRTDIPWRSSAISPTRRRT